MTWHELFVETQRVAEEDAARAPAFASRDDVVRFGLAAVPAGSREVVVVALGIR